jgi:hypothetical protein
MPMFNLNIQLKSLITLLVMLLISGDALSEDGVEDLGRLFVDVEQREKLEAVRRGTYEREVEQESRVSNVRVNGVMMRSDGKNVVWINGESTLDGDPVKGVKVNPDTADSETYNVQVQIDGKRVKLKPGQNWSEGTGTIKDNY